jgi:hypothetical protein
VLAPTEAADASISSPAAADAAPTPAAAARRRGPSLESLFVVGLVLFAFRWAANPISDNSMILHIRTGIDMVAGRGIPRVDPYSFTAHGAPWVVQSWLPEWSYGFLNRIGGGAAIVLEQAVLGALVAWLMVRLARTGDALRTAAAGVIVLGLGAVWWAPRPLLFGLLAMAVTITVVEHRRNPWFLVPVMWLWVNSHGSFPLAVLWLGAHLVGDHLDRGRQARDGVRYAVAMVVGLALAAVNPLGPRLLTFALAAGEKRQAFSRIVEWRSPDFQTPQGLVSLLCLGAALVLLFRGRPAWRHALPAVGFVVLGLFSLRNLPVAAIVLAPAVGRALRPGIPRPSVSPGRLNRVFLAVLVAGFILTAASAVQRPALATEGYPRAAVRYLERSGLRGPAHRLVTTDVVGGYLVSRDGRQARVFIDDRYDMYPAQVSRDYLALHDGRADAEQVLDRWNADVVLWEKDAPLTAILAAGNRWHRVYSHAGWVIFTR